MALCLDYLGELAQYRLKIRQFRAVFKGGGYGFNPPPRSVEKRFFGSVKNTPSDMRADALYVCTIVMPGKAIWRQ